MRGMRGKLPIRVKLLYDNDYQVSNQDIVQFVEEPCMYIEEREAIIRVRLLEASTWPVHENKHFYFRVSTPALVAGEQVTQCCTKAFQVLSKSIENLKAKLQAIDLSTKTGINDVRSKYGVDKQGVVGNRVVTSQITIPLNRSDHRKILLQQRLDNHNVGYKSKRPQPPQREQFRLFKMYNQFKMNRNNYFEGRKPPQRAKELPVVRKETLEYSSRQSRSVLKALRDMIPVVGEDEKHEPGAPSTKDNGLWKRNLPMYKKPAELALAKFYVEDYRFDEANELCERALKIQISSLGERHPVCALTLLLWGQSNRLQGLTEHALRRELLALQIRYENYHTIANDLCMQSLDAVCATHIRRRDFNAARQLCLDTRQRFLPDLGAAHQSILALNSRILDFESKYNRYNMYQEDMRDRRRYEQRNMNAEDFRSRELNVAKLNEILHAGDSLLGIKFLRMYVFRHFQL
jgi:hypothetical protein